MKLTKLSKLFDVKYGVNLELYTLDESEKRENGIYIPFVSRTENNNGVSAFVKYNEEIKPIPAGTLTVAAGGSVLSTFLQPYEYYSGRDLYFLTPKQNMTERELIYYSLCIKKNKYKYNYGRQANKTLKDLLVPENIPKVFLDMKIENLNIKSFSNKKLNLKDREWKTFILDDLFSFEKCKCGSAEKLLQKGGEVSYVGAKKDENGFMYKVLRDEKYITKGDCIVFIGDGQGSVGYSTYQEEDFIGSTTLTSGRNKYLNKYNAQFLITLLDKERFKYSFGRKWGLDKVKTTKIKLPINKNGDPDWQFMEEYIKGLPYSINV